MKKIYTAAAVILSCFLSNAQEDSVLKKPDYILDINAGAGFRLGTPAGEDGSVQQQYSKTLASGFHYDASFYVRLIPESGHFIGVKYNGFKKKSGAGGLSGTGPNGESFSGIEDKITLSFFGVGYMYNGEERKSEYSFEASAGYMHYSDRATLGENRYHITGGTVGLFLGASYYMKITNAISIGPKVDLQLGKISTLTARRGGNEEQIEPEGGESVSRVGLSLGARIHL